MSYPSAHRRPPGPGYKYPAPGQPAAKYAAAVHVAAAAAVAVTTAAATGAAAAAVAKMAAATATVAVAVVTVEAAALVTAAAAAIVLLCRHVKSSNPLIAVHLADGATGAATAPATTSSFQRLHHQSYADLPAVAPTRLRWDPVVAAGAASPLPHLFLHLFPHLLFAHSRFSHFPHNLRLKLMLLA